MPGLSSTSPERRATLAARICAICATHPAPALLIAALAVAVAGASGYLARAVVSQPAPVTTAAAPKINLGVQPSAAVVQPKVRDTVVWRDEAGAIYRAKVTGGRFDQFLRQRREVLEAARTDSRNLAAADILAALKPVFATMKGRVPRYADWYFGYTTRYELMAHAVLPTLDYLSHGLDRFVDRNPPAQKGLVQTIGGHMVDYLEEQYAEQVVKPREAETPVQAAFDKSYDSLRARWVRIIDDERRAMRAFINEEGGSKERLSAEQGAGLKLDWDGSRDNTTGMHKERTVDQSFRQGLLSVRLKIAKSAKAPSEPEIVEKTPEEADAITHVIVNLFDKVVGPVVSQMGDLVIGVFAGGAASGTTVGFGMAGVGAMGVATGVASAAPIGAAIGLAATVAAEMLSNRLEASLSRAEFEENIKQTVDVTENAVETKMIEVLDQHIEGWYVDIANPVAVK